MPADGPKHKHSSLVAEGGLYVLTADVPDLLARAEQVLAGGARLLQYRDKSNDHHKRLRQAEALRRLTRAAGAGLIINDDVALAAAVNADGVHLGRDDAALATARQRLGPDALIGVSCYNDLQRGRRMQAAGADYLAFGRVFPSRTKPEAVACSPATLRQAARALQQPVVAIGGIHAGNAGQVLDCGVRWLAVSAGVFLAETPEAAARELSQTLHSRGL